LQESFLRSFAGHSHIKALEHTIELRIGCAESPVFGKNFLLKFDHINRIGHAANSGFLSTNSTVAKGNDRMRGRMITPWNQGA
jgi:hypothetical protein